MNTASKLIGLIVCTATLLGWSAGGAQDTANWTGAGSDGLYSNPLNWDLGGVQVTSSLRYGQRESGPVSLSLFDVKVRRVRTLVDRPNQEVGQHEAVWDGRDDRGDAVPNGIYFAHLRTPSQATVRRITLLP